MDWNGGVRKMGVLEVLLENGRWIDSAFYR